MIINGEVDAVIDGIDESTPHAYALTNALRRYGSASVLSLLPALLEGFADLERRVAALEEN